MLFHIGTLLAAFALVWFSAGLVVDSIATMARRFRLTPFSFSFFFLGMFTSVSELMIGLNALNQGEPTIFVGNLLGASFVLFGLVLPLLALLAGGILFKKEVSTAQLALTLLYVALPAMAVSDSTVTQAEALLMIVGYPLVWILIKVRQQSVLVTMFDTLINRRIRLVHKTSQTLLGVILLMVASYLLVDQTIWLASALHTTPFLVSLLLLSLGSNLPELIVAIRATLKNKATVAYGSYLGSAVANSFFFGGLSLIYNRTIYVPDGLALLLPLIYLMLIMFFFFLRSQRGLSRVEGSIMLLFYLLYLVSEWQLGQR